MVEQACQEQAARQEQAASTFLLTNAFSKKVDNLGHAVAIHYMRYNFDRIHKTLRATPAMEAGV